MNYSNIKNFKTKAPEDYRGAALIERCERALDLSEDYILPDYLPDAKKILKFIAKPVIETRFTGNSQLEYSGSIYIKALYLAEDSSFRCATLSIPFEDRFSSEKICDECVDFLTPVISASQCRLQNPRKMNIKVKLSCKVEIWMGMSTLPEVFSSGKNSEGFLETDLKTIPSMNITCLREDDLSFSEDITLEKSMPDIDEIIFACADIVFDECRGTKNEILCRGNLLFECIYRSVGGENHYICRTLPINENLICEGAEPDSVLFALCLSKMPDTSVSEDEFGNRRVIELDVSYLTEISCMNKKDIFYAADAYSTIGNAETEFSKTEVYYPKDRIVSGFSVSESISAEEASLHSEDKIISYSLRPEMSLSEKPGKHGKLAFEGQCAVSLIVSRQENPAREVNFTLPLRFESDRPYTEGVSYQSKTICRASGARVRFDASRVYFDFEATLCAAVDIKNEIDLLTGVRLSPFSEKVQKSSSEITLYYPAKDESLWDIAKKYSITREAIALANGIGSSDIPSVIKIPS